VNPFSFLKCIIFGSFGHGGNGPVPRNRSGVSPRSSTPMRWDFFFPPVLSGVGDRAVPPLLCVDCRVFWCVGPTPVPYGRLNFPSFFFFLEALVRRFRNFISARPRLRRFLLSNSKILLLGACVSSVFSAGSTSCSGAIAFPTGFPFSLLPYVLSEFALTCSLLFSFKWARVSATVAGVGSR